MNLLAEIYSQGEMVPKMNLAIDLGDTEMGNLTGVGGSSDSDHDNNPYMLSILAPRLWPFMRHSITSVRFSAIRTLVIYHLFHLCFLLYTPSDLKYKTYLRRWSWS